MPDFTLAIPEMTQKDVERFWQKTVKSDGCWTFQSSTTRGYGRLGIGRRIFLAHRISYALATGESPEGKVICHTCDNPICVRPDHLFAGSRGDNNRDMFAKKRGNPRGGNYPKGENHHAAKLTNAEANEIKRLRAEGVYIKDLAVRFGVCQHTIKRIAGGKRQS